MTIELMKKMMDACYQAKRIREMLPPLPQGVTSSYIRYLDIIQRLERKGSQVKVSDLSDTLGIPRPGVTRTVKEMEDKGYLKKEISEEDRRITYLFITEQGKKLSEKYNEQVFDELLSLTQDISEEDAECTIRTIHKIYEMMSERRK